MKASDILLAKVKQPLKTTSPDDPLMDAIRVMVESDIGSLIVLEQGKLVGMLTFREVMQAIANTPEEAEKRDVRSTMKTNPMTCTPDTEVEDLCAEMIARHARYIPVLENAASAPVGVISFYDVAKAVLDRQGYENHMLKAYISGGLD